MSEGVSLPPCLVTEGDRWLKSLGVCTARVAMTTAPQLRRTDRVHLTAFSEIFPVRQGRWRDVMSFARYQARPRDRHLTPDWSVGLATMLAFLSRDFARNCLAMAFSYFTLKPQKCRSIWRSKVSAQDGQIRSEQPPPFCLSISVSRGSLKFAGVFRR